MRDFLIIGGSDAGISAALRARELDPEVVPTLLVADKFPNFSICGLPYFVSREVRDWRSLAHRTVGEIEAQGVRVFTDHTAQAIDPETKSVSVLGPGGAAVTLSYDKLLIATGAVSVRPSIPGTDSPGVFFLRWMPECLAIDSFIDERKPRTAVIMGAGYIGMEMSEALTKRGTAVSVVEMGQSVMPSVDSDLGALVRETLLANGVAVHTGVTVEGIREREGCLAVACTGGLELAADMVLVSVGSTPNTKLGESIGLPTGLRGALKVNRRMETAMSGIYAAGDCVETWHRALDRYVYLPLGTVAHKQGRVVGENAVGGARDFAGTLGTQSVKLFDRVIARTGLSEREALQAGFRPTSADLEAWDHKAYYPGAQQLLIRVLADADSRRLLGAQMLGAHGTEVSKRIDIVATAIHHGMTAADFSEYDLSYTPPLSSPWDPVQMAVQKLERKLTASAMGT